MLRGKLRAKLKTMDITERITAGRKSLEQLEKERAWAWVGALLSVVALCFALFLSAAIFLPVSFPDTLNSILLASGASFGTASLFYFAIDKARDPNRIGTWYKGLWVGNATATVIVFLAPPLIPLAIGPVMAGTAIVRRLGSGRMVVFLLAPLVSLGVSYAIRVLLPGLRIPELL